MQGSSAGSLAGIKLEKQNQEKDPERFYCPFPGCNRSFAELWRLKVHFRAPPDIRGSGKERGHGTELTQCPKCGKSLKPGKHHVGCSAGRSAPRQSTKRVRLTSPDPALLELALFKDDQALLSEGPESLMQQLVGSFPQQMFGMDGTSQQQVQSDFLLQQQQQQQHAMQLVAQQQQDQYTVLHAQMGFSQQQLSMYHPVLLQEQHVDLPTDLSAMFASFPNASVAPVQQPASSAIGPTLNFQPDESLNFFSLFEYNHPNSSLDSHQPPTPPSPPPLPVDFDGSRSNPMMFQFAQFSQKLPSNIPTASAPSLPGDNPTATTMPHPPAAAAASCMPADSWSAPLGYDKSNDGDLMHILFGLPDEFPTMATVHLHQWEQPAADAAPSEALVQSQQQQQQPDSTLLDCYDSPRFTALVSTGMECSLDLNFVHMDADGEAPHSGSSSETAVEPSTNEEVLHEESHADSHAPCSHRKGEGFPEGGPLEPMLSPTDLVKGDRPALPRTNTFERELYHLLRPCE